MRAAGSEGCPGWGGSWFHLPTFKLVPGPRVWALAESWPGVRWQVVSSSDKAFTVWQARLSGPSCLHNKGSGGKVPQFLPLNLGMPVTSFGPVLFGEEGTGEGRGILADHTHLAAAMCLPGSPWPPGTDGATGQWVSSSPTPATPVRFQGPHSF